MGKLKLRTFTFVDFVDLKYPGVTKLNFIYPICNCRLVMLVKFVVETGLVVCMQIFLHSWYS